MQSSLQAPLCLVVLWRLFTVSDQMNFVLATEAWFSVTAKMHETIPDTLTLMLKSQCCLCQHLQDGLLDHWAQKPSC